MKKLMSALCLALFAVLSSCDSHVFLTFDKDFGSELNASFSGDQVEGKYGSMQVGSTKTNFETLEGLCKDPILTRLEDELQFSCTFNDIEQLNSLVMKAEGIEEWAMEEMEGFHNVRWSGENTLVLTKYFLEDKLQAEGPLRMFVPSIEARMGKSKVELDMAFEHEIDSVMIMPDMDIELGKKNLEINTDLQAIWDDEGVLLVAVVFKENVKPK